jgi:hypothetical protein
MPRQSTGRGPYKKVLSIFEIGALVKEHASSAIFSTNRKGERMLEPWLKALRFNQAWEIAEKVLGVSIDQNEFQECWARTLPPRKTDPTPSTPPNTATFGGYRLKTRSALNRAQKEKPRPKKK